mmetsp:Transcript_21159/g.56404  ORF Transcript_21159/g.56404 Transcript_21159/m.56404 type:complete len:244 (-) Transcript_21159:369-1100(-)
MHRRLAKELPQLQGKTLANDGLAVEGCPQATSSQQVPAQTRKAAGCGAGSDSGALCTSFVALLAGPMGSPYEGGVFRLDVEVPAGYPLEPPKIKFATRIFHPNVGRGHTPGAICLDILRKEAWSPALTIERTLLSIASLLADPNPASPMDTEAAKLYTSDRDAYDRRVKLWVKKYARSDASGSDVMPDGAWTADFGKADDVPPSVGGATPATAPTGLGVRRGSDVVIHLSDDEGKTAKRTRRV